jgi:Carboxypeptidase regulatory-like domain
MRWETAAIDANGSLVLDHVAAGRTMVTLMAFTPASPMVRGSSTNTLTSVASREVEVREGETTSVDLPLRDVVVAGRATRAGQPEPGVLVSVMMMGQGSSVMTWGGPSAARLALPGPLPLAGTTRDDGSYELLLFTPGPAYVQMTGGAQGFPGRQVEIPDVDRFELDLEIGGATVSGIVVDRESGEPVAEAFVGLRRTDGGSEGSGGAESSADGRFSIATEPGEYRLEARARERRSTPQALSVGPSGVADLRIEMEPGLEIRGRLLEVSGRPAAGYLTVATAADGEESGYANSGGDGTFRIGGLAPKAHAIVGGSELSGYAFQPAVTPGEEPLVLTLRPAGHISVRVVDPAGQPVRDAYPRVETIDGARVRMPGRVSGQTDASGLYELASPPGTVEVAVGSEKGSGRGSASVRSGETTPLTVVLQPRAPKQP